MNRNKQVIFLIFKALNQAIAGKFITNKDLLSKKACYVMKYLLGDVSLIKYLSTDLLKR